MPYPFSTKIFTQTQPSECKNRQYACIYFGKNIHYAVQVKFEFWIFQWLCCKYVQVSKTANFYLKIQTSEELWTLAWGRVYILYWFWRHQNQKPQVKICSLNWYSSMKINFMKQNSIIIKPQKHRLSQSYHVFWDILLLLTFW